MPLICQIVHNDFHQTHGLFHLFDGLAVPNIDKPFQHVNNGVKASFDGATKTPPVEKVHPLANELTVAN